MDIANDTGGMIRSVTVGNKTTNIVLLALLYGQSRIFFALSREGLLPPVFSQVHTKTRTPWISSIIIGVVVMLVAGLTPIDILTKLVNIGTLAAVSARFDRRHCPSPHSAGAQARISGAGRPVNSDPVHPRRRVLDR